MSFQTIFKNPITEFTNIHLPWFATYQFQFQLLIISSQRIHKWKIILFSRWLEDGSMRKTESDSDHVARVRRLETAAMRKWLARRRWARACHIIRATIRMKSVGDTSTNLRPEYHRMRSYGDAAAELLPEYYSSDVEVWIWGGSVKLPWNLFLNISLLSSSSHMWNCYRDHSKYWLGYINKVIEFTKTKLIILKTMHVI